MAIIGRTGRDGGSIRIEMERLNMLEREASAARIEMIARKTRLEALEGLEGESLIAAAAYTVADPSLMALRQHYQDATVSLAACKAPSQNSRASSTPPSKASRPVSASITRSPGTNTNPSRPNSTSSRRRTSRPSAPTCCPSSAPNAKPSCNATSSPPCTPA